MIIAIDGPAGAGKSTVARRLAERLGFRYLDTGAMYRALTWLAMREGMPLGEGEPLGLLARTHPITFDEVGRVFIDSSDVTSAIRQPRIDRMVPVVARHHEVREVMRERQRELAGLGNAVIEGRDIGTVVAPDAEVKVYLRADPEIRARRRQAERPDIGADALATDLRARDESDRVRMQPAADAELIDTTDLEVDDVVAQHSGADLEPLAHTVLTGQQVAWALGRVYMGWPTRAVSRARAYGRDRVPAQGGLVYAINHLHWLDVPLVGALSPRVVDFVAKVEVGKLPAVGRFIEWHGAILVRRGASDRDAVRQMRQAARDGHVVGLFVEGTRMSSGRPGPAQPGAAMVAVQENVPVVPIAVYGTQFWKPGDFAPCSLAFGEPVRFEGLPKGGKGYKEATGEIERRIGILFDWLADVHAHGRPRDVVPPL